jgi:4-amino-4-deoxy-L-arabinose transferase-like glycosyltransferase
MDIIVKNKVLIVLIVLYSLAMLSIISWGIPTAERPFTYNMDEWHQLSAVRALFAQGTPNVPGAAHGSIFQFLLSGIYLVPFTILGIINPFTIHSSISNLAMQGKIFMVLRLNTLLFGILSIITLSIVAKKYLKNNSILTAILFMGTPIWLVLSSYFKYDIALVFWITLSILFILRFSKRPAFKNYILSAVPCALSFATKVSAIPMLLIYIFSFFWFAPHWQKKLKYLIWGLIIFTGISVIFGIPDLIFRWGDWKEYLSSNLITSIRADSNYLLGAPNKWIYILFNLFPIIFGHIFYIIFIISFTYWLFIIAKWLYFKKYKDHKVEIFLFSSLVVFFLSLIPLGLGASGNRSLVLLPFFGLLSAKFLVNILKFGKYKLLFLSIISILVLLQLHESSIVIYSKYGKSILWESSEWITTNISEGTIIGIENIPIYQTLPDVALSGYYLNSANKYAKKYSFEVINALSNKLPKIVIITNKYLDEKYLKNSLKKDLLTRLKKENYKAIEEFLPSKQVYKLFRNDLGYYLSGLNFVYPVTIYERG